MPRRRSSPSPRAPDDEEHPHHGDWGATDETLRFPMVLRRVSPARRRLAETLLGAGWEPDRVCWELVDAAGDDAQPPAALALTHRPEDLSGAVVRVEAVAAQDTALLTRLVGDLVAVLRSSGVETLSYGSPAQAELRAAQAVTAQLIGPGDTRTITGPDDLEPHVLHFDL